MRKYNDKMRRYLEKYAQHYTINELIDIVEEKFGEKFEPRNLRIYLLHKGIKYKYELPKKSNNGKPTKIGSQVIKTDGNMIKVKVADHKWEYKQRKIYEDYYGIKLPDDVYVIFLDGNKRNFDIKNLKAISRRESAIMIKNDVFSIDRTFTKLGHLATKMYIKTKRKEEIK